MAAAAVWSQASLDDIDAIAEYIHRDSPYHAWRVIEALLVLSDSIGEQPLIGRVVPELRDERVCERFLYSCRLIYALGKQRIEGLAVIHGRRLPESIERPG